MYFIILDKRIIRVLGAFLRLVPVQLIERTQGEVPGHQLAVSGHCGLTRGRGLGGDTFQMQEGAES